MIEILNKMAKVMPLELWGIFLGLAISMFIYLGFLLIKP